VIIKIYTRVPAQHKEKKKGRRNMNGTKVMKGTDIEKVWVQERNGKTKKKATSLFCVNSLRMYGVVTIVL